MTVAPPEQDLDTIEHLDFEHEIPCEWDGHPDFGRGPAVWLVRFKALPCGHSEHYRVFLCDECLRFLHTKTFHCAVCRRGNYRLAELVAEVRPLHP